MSCSALHPSTLFVLTILATATVAQQQRTESTVSVSGTVTGPLGEPVPLAEVWVEHQSRDLARTRSDGGGFFVVRVPRGRLPVDAAYVHLQAKAAGFGTSSQAVPFQERAVVHFRLWEAATVSGQVIDRRGQTVSGAVVWAAYNASRQHGLAVSAQTVTAADGTFRLAGVPLGWPHLHCHTKDGFGQRVVRVESDVDGVRLVVGETPTIAISIAFTGLRPEESARVRLIPFDQNGALALPEHLGVRHTDEIGLCHFPSMPAGLRYYVRPLSPSYSFEPRMDNLGGDQTKPGAHPRCEIAAQPLVRGVLRGKLVTAGGRPLIHQQVHFEAYGHSASEMTSTTTTDGSFRFEGEFVPGAPAGLRLTNADLVLVQPLNQRQPARPPLHLDRWLLETDLERTVQVIAAPGGIVEGQALTPTGEPVRFRSVSLQSRSPKPGNGCRSQPSQRTATVGSASAYDHPIPPFESTYWARAGLPLSPSTWAWASERRT